MDNRGVFQVSEKAHLQRLQVSRADSILPAVTLVASRIRRTKSVQKKNKKIHHDMLCKDALLMLRTAASLKASNAFKASSIPATRS